MGVVEVDQVLERLRVAGAGVGREIARDVGLELAQEGVELAIEAGPEVDLERVDDRRPEAFELGDRGVEDRDGRRIGDVGVVRAPDADARAFERVRVEELGVVGEGVAGLGGGGRVVRVDADAAPRRTAASVTLRAIGPAVSWSAEIGTTPARLHSPSVGLIPTSPF